MVHQVASFFFFDSASSEVEGRAVDLQGGGGRSGREEIAFNKRSNIRDVSIVVGVVDVGDGVGEIGVLRRHAVAAIRNICFE